MKDYSIAALLSNGDKMLRPRHRFYRQIWYIILSDDGSQELINRASTIGEEN